MILLVIRKFILIPVILLLFLITVKAEASNPYYTARGTYDAESSTYTVDVYLTTEDYLAEGMFGIEFDDAISPVWHDGTVEDENIGYLQIDTRYFTLIEPPPFIEAHESLQGKKYAIAMWSVNETDAQNPVRGELHLGTITVPDVTLNAEGYPDGWSDKPFRLLNWKNTDLANNILFTRIDENDETSSPINDEIWRDITEAEKTSLGANAPEGYYQGFIFDLDGNSTQTDIDFTFISELEYPNKVISGSVEGYNPKNTVQIAVYSVTTGEAYAAGITGYAIYADGRTVYDYEIKVPEDGTYTVVYSKQSHLTYATDVTIAEKETELPYLKLLCGDINGDGYIKLPDRANLIRFLNRQKPTTYTTQFDLSDLNGDGLVNLFDIGILKANMNKTYN